MKEYSNALEYLYGLEKFGILFGLENIRWILNIVGNPQGSFKSVHIGGTNGKGSVASMLSHMLREAGYRVGRYTSPHLVSFTERIAVDEEDITEAEVTELTGAIWEKLEREDANRVFTFFDFTTALAFEHFQRRHVDIAVVEVGLGGRLDSTNVVEPLLTVITNVDFDHMDYLGNTITEIAREKAGIIKDGVPVITGAVDVSRRILDETASIHGSSVYALGRDFGYRKIENQVMSYTGLTLTLDNVLVKLKGDHQLVNGAIALCTAELLRQRGFPIEQEALYSGLSQATWPGRLEVIMGEPTIILDGAHNAAGAKALAEFLESRYPDKRKVMVFGVMQDKAYDKMLELLLPHVDATVLTKPAIDRGLAPEALRKHAPEAAISEDVRSALTKAKTMASGRDLILITGSLYVVGEARTIVHDVF
jgi:dihydrofolate synthase/folylpolyglutamate synthase